MAQTYTSANTSINNVKLPALYNKVKLTGNVLDYGCGKYVEHLRRKALQSASSFWFYDKYNQSKITNNEALDFGYTYGFNTIVCANVLNVIDDETTICSILNELMCLLHRGGDIYIQIYEGDKSGTRKVTKCDCYQRNESVKAYGRFLNEIGAFTFNTEYKGNIIHIYNVKPIFEKGEGGEE